MLALTEVLRSTGRLAIAFSGGTDSALLASEAIRVLGKTHVLILHAESVLLPACDRRCTQKFRETGWNIRSVPVNPLSLPEVRVNASDRCYHCKKAIFAALLAEAEKSGFPILADGTNTDDLLDFRPGMQAAEELGVRHPFLECNMNKNQIRKLARERGLPNWDLPASACLASRIPNGIKLEESLLRKIDACEEALANSGFRGFRVRFMDPRSVRLELPPDQWKNLAFFRESILESLAKQGFDRVLLDLKGYRPGGLKAREEAAKS